MSTISDNIIGYETFDAGSNPNYTRSYGYTMEPTTHTGVLMSYVFCEAFSANVGIANTPCAREITPDRAFLGKTSTRAPTGTHNPATIRASVASHSPGWCRVILTTCLCWVGL